MKTSRKFKNQNSLAVLLFVFASLLFMASCQKEEQASPSSGQSISGMRQIQPPGDIGPVDPVIHSFMLKIDHKSGRSNLPDYSVTVFSDRPAVYEGRRNVFVQGKVEFIVTRANLSAISQLIDASHFFNIVDDLPYNVSRPMILTSYSDWERNKTLVDYNTGYPAALTDLRKKVEETLHITNFLIDIRAVDTKPQIISGSL